MSLLPGLQNLQNVHPLFVHFPVALILVALFSEAVWWLTGKDHFRRFAIYLLCLSALSAVAAVITGYIASNSLGHDTPGHDFVHEHRDVMLWMSGLLVVTTVVMLFVRSFREGKWRRLLIVPLLVIAGLLVYGADKGGRLVFEYGIGIKAVSEKAIQETTSHEDEDGSESEDFDNHTSMPDSNIKSGDSDGHDHVH